MKYKKINRNSLAQFMKTRTRVFWPSFSQGTYRRPARDSMMVFDEVSDFTPEQWAALDRKAQ